MLTRVGSNLKTLPLRHLGGGAIPGLRSNFSGSERYNQSIGDGGILKLSGLGWGHLPPSTWLMPYKAGAISSRNDSPIEFVVNSLNVALGQNIEGAANILFSAAGSGQAVASLSGSTVITFTSSGALSAPFNMAANGTISFASSGTLRADTSISGSSLIQFNSNLTTGAIGFMIAVPIDTSLTPDSVAQAVWSATAAGNNTTGSMGEKLNDAGSASNPWTEVIESGLTASDIMKLILAVQAGKTEIDGATVKFKSVDGLTDRVTAEMTGSERVDVDLNPS